jgi:hypothetical protein
MEHSCLLAASAKCDGRVLAALVGVMDHILWVPLCQGLGASKTDAMRRWEAIAHPTTCRPQDRWRFTIQVAGHVSRLLARRRRNSLLKNPHHIRATSLSGALV